jgi:aryl-alcohol dehydrogenase-like predicted oxidoreductase
LVKHLGISCYRPDYAQKALANPDLSIVEVPANIFDRRVFRAGLLDMARDLQKLVLVRSVLLQGLALLRSEQIPNSLPAVAQGLATLHRFCATHHLNPREFAYDYARAISPNALIVLGAESAEQVAQNCLLPRRPPLDQKLIELWDEAWPEDKPELYDPARWQDAFQAGPIQFPSSNDPT